MPSKDIEASRTGSEPMDARIARIEDVGTAILRYGIVFLLVVIGAAKYFAFEAEAIKPLVQNSPFLSWMLGAFVPSRMEVRPEGNARLLLDNLSTRALRRLESTAGERSLGTQLELRQSPPAADSK